ncbi:hypothetical protein HMPREF9098_2004 [Kingella denitrificans ATCC 33394]|uniref:Uncharacterized protein n=1 Tax=Kingella denitrificans ATCC 33394 TaxID=888741 RepID=F0F1L9_9NEIS|nr:hypothetical protein HMPREF9098_2004 [Kingella denitrificans ATCC 33394]
MRANSAGCFDAAVFMALRRHTHAKSSLHPKHPTCRLLFRIWAMQKQPAPLQKPKM